MVPGETTTCHSDRQTSAGYQFIEAHHTHAQSLLPRGVVSQVAQNRRHLHSGGDSGQHLQAEQIGKRILGWCEEEQCNLEQTEKRPKSQEDAPAPAIAQAAYNWRER